MVTVTNPQFLSVQRRYQYAEDIDLEQVAERLSDANPELTGKRDELTVTHYMDEESGSEVSSEIWEDTALLREHSMNTTAKTTRLADYLDDFEELLQDAELENPETQRDILQFGLDYEDSSREEILDLLEDDASVNAKYTDFNGREKLVTVRVDADLESLGSSVTLNFITDSLLIVIFDGVPSEYSISELEPLLPEVETAVNSWLSENTV